MLYPIYFPRWKVLRVFSISPEPVLITEDDELSARKRFEAHKQSVGRGALYLVGPGGRIEESHTARS